MEDIKVVVRDGEELLKASVRGVKEKAISGAQTTERTVREYPYQTLGIVFGVGVALGVLLASLAKGETSFGEE